MASASREGSALFAHPLAGAVFDVVAKRGYHEASVAEMISRSNSSSEEFESLFEDKEDAMLRVFAASIEDFKLRVGAAFASASPWPESLRASAHEAVRWMQEHQAATRFMLVGVFAVGERALVMRDELIAWCAGLIDAGRDVVPDPLSVPAGAPMIAMGATVEILSRHLQGTEGAAPIELLPQMMYSAVRPYLGEDAARRELKLPIPADLRS
jgi:hypothetical protein